jgi:AcrR family transcriptional regulator
MAVDVAELGLRELKKKETRQLLRETAVQLFSERGFEQVPVSEIARVAQVSAATVFNYFPTKEDLFYGGMEIFEERLLEAVRTRPAGESILSAFRSVVLGSIGRLGSDEVADTIAGAARIVGESPALQAREREVVAEYTARLAEIVAEETGAAPGAVEPRAVATALMGVQRALVAYVHETVLAGKRGRTLTAAVRREGERAFARLEQGLAGYGAAT